MAIRTFEKLTAGGWSQTPVNKLISNDIIQVKDDGVVVGFAADALLGDAKIYVVSQAQKVVVVPVVTASGVREQAIALTG